MDAPRGRPPATGDAVVWLEAGDDTSGGGRRGEVLARPAAAPRTRRRLLGGLAVAVAVGGLVVARGEDVAGTAADVVAPRPDASLVLDGRPVVEPADAEQRGRLRDLAARAETTWRRTLAGLGAAPSSPSSDSAGPIVDAGDGRHLGLRWEALTALGQDGQWSLAAEVARRAPSPSVDPCRPAAWGQPGGRVLRCDVSAPDDGVRLVRAEAVAGSSAASGRSPEPLAAWASPVPDEAPGARSPEQVAGYQRVVEVRDGEEWVQVRLLRRLEGDARPPLDLVALTAIATDPTWHDG